MAGEYDAPKIAGTDNWAAKGHQGIYDMLQSSVQPARIAETGQDFADCGTRITRAFEDLSKQLGQVLNGQWSGEAAAKGVESSEQLVRWGRTLGEAASRVGGGMQRAGSTAGAVKSSVGKPKEFDPVSVLLPSILPGGAIIGAIDAKRQVDAINADEAAAVRVMSSVYSPDYAAVDSTVPAFLPPLDPTQPQPEPPPHDPGRPGPGQPWVPPGGRNPRNPGTTGTDPGRGGGGVVPQQDPPQGGVRPVEPPPQGGDRPGQPPPVQPPNDLVRPGEHPRPPVEHTDLSGYPAPVEKTPGGPPGGPVQNLGHSGGGQGAGGGYLGGFAAGGAGGAAGAGSGALGRGGAAGVGFGPGLSGAGSAALAGKPGAPGAPGGMAPGGAAGRGEEDKEHETADYLVNEDNLNELIGDLGRVAPPVIGE